MIGTIVLSALIGFLLGLGLCYYGQLKKVVENRDKIGAIGDLVEAGTKTFEAFKF